MRLTLVLLWLAGAALGLAPLGAAVSGTADAQAYSTMAGQPDPLDFVKRSGTGLTVQGNPMRFVGYDIGWLGFKPDGSPPAAPPDAYVLGDALSTVQALGGTVVRTRPGGDLASLDAVLKIARDAGLKVIVPLAGDLGSCDAALPDGACALMRRRGLSDPNTFFTDAGVRADYLAGVMKLFGHVNALTGRAYREDPTILAWENCLACAASADPAAAAAWVEQVGQAIKAADPNHLYENGAFAGRVGSASPVPAAVLMSESVDIVGDDLATGSDPVVARTRLEGAAGIVAGAGKAYVMDSTGWSAAQWKTQDDLSSWLHNLVRQRSVAGVVFGRLEAHAAGGGFLPAAPAEPGHGVAPLYFPGIPVDGMTAAEMQDRGRALRRFAYDMAELVMSPAYLLPPRPRIISAARGRLVWQGSAGAVSYTVERSPDAAVPGSWEVVCDACTSDSAGSWQDPSPPAEPAWYRIMPINVNGHKSTPSEPVQATR